MQWTEVNSINSRLSQEIDTIRHDRRKRVKVQVFLMLALWIYLGSLVTLFAGRTYQAFDLWSVVPFLLLYRLVRDVFFGGQGWVFRRAL
jgi:hypothetical protein